MSPDDETIPQSPKVKTDLNDHMPEPETELQEEKLDESEDAQPEEISAKIPNESNSRKRKPRKE